MGMSGGGGCVFLVLAFLVVVVKQAEAAEQCPLHTIFVLPLYVRTTVDTEFDKFYSFLYECQIKAINVDLGTKIKVLSLSEHRTVSTCMVGDDCSDMFTHYNSSMNATDFGNTFYVDPGNGTYDWPAFLKQEVAYSRCLATSVMVVPTNIRCIQVKEYDFFWNAISELYSDVSKYINYAKMKTTIIWLNYGYLSPTDNIGCELDYLLKPAGSLLSTLATDKDGQYLVEAAALKTCSDIPLPKNPPLSKPLLIVVIVVCSFVLLLGLACVVLCVLKVKYRYEILKLDFLFRHRRNKEDDLPINNYYTMNGAIEGADKWELTLSELDIDYDNVLGSGAFAYVVQGTLTGQHRIKGTAGGIQMFNGNLVAVKILHSTADEIIKNNFIREIELMKSFDPHPHLLNLIGCVPNPDNPLLISELCENGSLREILIKHPPHDLQGERPHCESSEVVCLRGKDLTLFSWQISDAMCYLAAHTFVHRDIAARNVFITRALTAKRPEVPADAPEAIGDLMRTCWNHDPEKRPTFDEIRSRLSGLLDVCSQAYGYLQFASESELPEGQTAADPSAPQADSASVTTASMRKGSGAESEDESDEKRRKGNHSNHHQSNGTAVH
ncbi:Protein tyrosine kinase [Aphelenchoides fujianensis]|nr:Protein tyrosine kinase [Aphelenchoides fujianensis]